MILLSWGELKECKRALSQRNAIGGGERGRSEEGGRWSRGGVRKTRERSESREQSREAEECERWVEYVVFLQCARGSVREV